MSTTLSDLTTLINDRRRDTTSNSIDMTTVGLRAINSTLDIWNSLHDWQWTIKTANFNYNAGITTYPMPVSDFKTPVTLKPYKEDKTPEYWLVSDNKFDSAVEKNRRFAVQNTNRVQYLRVNGSEGSTGIIEPCTRYDGNGTWVGAGAIGSVSTDLYEGYGEKSSVKFVYTGTSGTLTNSTLTKVDLSRFKDRSNIYLDVDITENSNLTSFTLKWGTDASNYYTVTTTTEYLGEAFKEEWNRLKFSWNNPTTVGTPTDSSIGYLQLTVAYGSNPGGVVMRVQNIFVSENVPLTLKYYSTNMVYDVSGATQLQHFNDATATTDYPLWSGQWDAVTEAFINSCLEIVFWITGEYNDVSVARQKIADIVNPLKERYPSQRRKPSLFVTTDTNY